MNPDRRRVLCIAAALACSCTFVGAQSVADAVDAALGERDDERRAWGVRVCLSTPAERLLPFAERVGRVLRLDSTDPAVLAAAVRIARAAEFESDLVRQIALDRGMPEPAREAAVPALSAERLRDLLLDSRAPSRLRVAALRALRPHADPSACGLDRPAWTALLGSEDRFLAESAGEQLVHSRAELDPVLIRVLLRNAEARPTFLTVLSDRPRFEAVAAVDDLLAESADAESADGKPVFAVPLHDRCLALAVASPDAQAEHGRILFDALTEQDQPLRAAATLAATRLAPVAADRLIGVVHARLTLAEDEVENPSVRGGLLRVLERISPRGRVFLAGVLRTLAPEVRDSVLDLLERQGADAARAVLVDLADEMFAATDRPLDRSLLLSLQPDQLDDPDRVARLLAVFGDEEQVGSNDPKLRWAAFVALAKTPPELLPYARAVELACDADEGERGNRLGTLLRYRSVPEDRGVLRELWLDDATRGQVAQRLFVGGEVSGDAVATLRELVADDGVAEVAKAPARRALVAFGEEETVRWVFDNSSLDQRLECVEALSRRTDRERPWVERLLRSLEADSDQDLRARAALLRAGVGEILDELLAQPREWPVAWLRRLDDAVARVLDARRVARLVELVEKDPHLSRRRRTRFVHWIALRPDLDDGGFLWRTAGGDALLEPNASDALGEHGDVQSEALRGLLARESERARIRASLTARLLDSPVLLPADEERVLDVLGAEPLPLSAEAARLAALAFTAERGQDEHATFGPDSVLVHAVGRLFREGLSAEAAGAFVETTDSRRTSMSLHASAQDFNAVLVALWRVEGGRPDPAAAIARWITASGDDRPAYDGPAYLALGEAAERRGAYAEAADAYERAHTALFHHPPPPLVRRAVLGDSLPEFARVPLAELATRACLMRVRADVQSSEPERAWRRWRIAEILSYGDRTAAEAVRDCAADLESLGLDRPDQRDDPNRRER